MPRGRNSPLADAHGADAQVLIVKVDASALMNSDHEKRHIIRVLVLWAIWAAVVILAHGFLLPMIRWATR